MCPIKAKDMMVIKAKDMMVDKAIVEGNFFLSKDPSSNTVIANNAQ